MVEDNDTSPLTGDAEAESVEESQAGLAPVPIADAVMQLLRASHHMSRELKPIWDEAQRDGLEGEPGVPGPPGAGATKFTSVATGAISAGAANNDLICEGEIPASSLPDQPFYWIAEGSGEGGFFATNVRLPGMTSGATSDVMCQLEDHNGQWATAGRSAFNVTSLPPGIPTLYRISVYTTAGAIGNMIHHYDPTVDNGIPFRVIIGSNSTLVPGPVEFGLQVELIVFG